MVELVSMAELRWRAILNFFHKIIRIYFMPSKRSIHMCCLLLNSRLYIQVCVTGAIIRLEVLLRTRSLQKTAATISGVPQHVFYCRPTSIFLNHLSSEYFKSNPLTYTSRKL